jgi:hypothetical protein
MIITTEDGRQLEVDIDPSYRAAVISLRCPYCGQGPFRMLAGHTKQKHGVGSFELKNLAGMVVKDSLVDDELRERKKQHGTELWTRYGIPKRRTKRQPKRTLAALAEQKRKSIAIAHDTELVMDRQVKIAKTKKQRKRPLMSRSRYLVLVPRVSALLSSGKSGAEISRVLGIPTSCVFRLIKRIKNGKVQE